MDSQQMRLFMSTARCHSFSEAASRTFTSTASVSRSISKLEQELSVTLFNRSEHGISLTEAGQALYDGWREMSEQQKVLLDEVIAIDRGITGTLSVGILDGQMLDLSVRNSIEVFENRYPHNKVALCRQSYGELIGSLDAGSIDLAFTLSLTIEGQEHIASIPVCPLPTKLVIPQNHPLRGKRGLTLDMFANDTFLTTADAPGYPYIENLFKPYGVVPKVVAAPTIGDEELWLEVGRGVAIANPNHMMCNSPSLTEVDIAELPDYEFVAAYREDANSALLNAYLEVLKECISY